MKTVITSTSMVMLKDVPEDEMLVIYQGKLCIREFPYGLTTEYGEMLSDITNKTSVSRIKSIKVEI